MASGISATLQDRYPLKSNGIAKIELNGSYFLEERERGGMERERTCRWMLRKVDLEGNEGVDMIKLHCKNKYNGIILK